LRGLEGALFKKPINPGKLRQVLVQCRNKTVQPSKGPVPVPQDGAATPDSAVAANPPPPSIASEPVRSSRPS